VQKSLPDDLKKDHYSAFRAGIILKQPCLSFLFRILLSICVTGNLHEKAPVKNGGYAQIYRP